MAEDDPAPPAPPPADPRSEPELETARTSPREPGSSPRHQDAGVGAVRGEVHVPEMGANRYGPGDRIGENYRLRGLLGQGGMGDVWLAHNEALDVDVAVKLVRPASGEKDAAERLLREARAAARLGHPAIVRVFDFGQTDGGDPFIVMERLEGEDLATALGRLGKLRPAKAVRTLLPIAHALVAAHGKGIVHRDLKPENVFLARNEGDRLQPKIVDFGIAQVDRIKNPGAPNSGELLGSPAYMAPEQARGGEVDERADQWSFAVVLYEAIAGVRPFIGETPDAVLQAILSASPPRLPGTSGADDDLWAIVRRALEKDPSARFPTMKEFGEALAGWLLASGVNEDITGAALQTAWGLGPEPAHDNSLGSLRPLPHLDAPRAGLSTQIRNELPAPGPPSSNKLVLITAGVAAVLGTLIGVLVGAKPHPRPNPATSASSGATRAPGSSEVASRPKEAIPVEPLDQIPLDNRAVGSAPTPGVKGAAGPHPKPQAGFGHEKPGGPKRILKDPFR